MCVCVCMCMCRGVCVCVCVSHVSVDGLAGVRGGLSEGVHVGEHLAGGALQAELIKVGVGQDVLLGGEALPAQPGNLNTFSCFCLGKGNRWKRIFLLKKKRKKCNKMEYHKVKQNIYVYQM